MNQPLGTGTKEYSEHEIMHMIYDSEQFSIFSERFDQLKILSSNPNSEFTVNS